MAADEETGVVIPLIPDSFHLVRKEKGVQFFYVKDGTPMLIREALDSAGMTEDGEIEFMGRVAGKLHVEATDAQNEIPSSDFKELLEGWFPPVDSKVHHFEGGLGEFNEIVDSNEFVVGKFSAEWCGPCKAIAPKIAKMSVEYPGVKFLHIDVDQQVEVKTHHKINCMPTFLFWKNGTKLDEKIEGGNVAQIYAMLKQEAGEPEELDAGEPFKEEITLKITCHGDRVKLEKIGNKVTLSINGVVKTDECPEIKINREKRSFTLGRSPMDICNQLPEDEFHAICDAVDAMWPTNVHHVHNDAEFRQILQDNPKVVAKFSADWCGPCHQIAPKYTELSLEHTDIKFLHIDVDQCKALSQKEYVQAMPTFKFYLKGASNGDFMLRGANKASLEAKVKEFDALPEN